MGKVLVAFLAACLLHTTSGDINISDYIYWKKADITAWHQFFPSRYLQQEQVTLIAALAAVEGIASGLNASLSSIVAFQAQELTTAQLLMQGTDAEGCVNGIANYMPTSIENEMETYMDCAADASSKLLRLNATWTKVRNSYIGAWKRALNGIDACAKTYPNKGDIRRLMSCVDSMDKTFFAAANATQNAMIPSPSMTYFKQVVVGCATTAAQNVADNGLKFLGMLLECSTLAPSIDHQTYEEELYKWQGYNDTLQSQINSSQAKNHDQVLSVEVQMVEYYNLQKKALESWVIESRGLQYYLNQTYLLLADYYNTVTTTSLDNPGDSGCVDDAKATLDTLASNVSSKSLSCDISIVNSTKELMGEVFNSFMELNNLMPSIGNSALLNCFSQGYIFAEDTILDCFDLGFWSFHIEHTDRSVDIEADVAVLENYATKFFSGSNLPCGGSSLNQLLLGGDVTLYKLRRCLYVTSGSTYAVTTPKTTAPTTPTTVPTVTSTGSSVTLLVTQTNSLYD